MSENSGGEKEKYVHMIKKNDLNPNKYNELFSVLNI